MTLEPTLQTHSIPPSSLSRILSQLAIEIDHSANYTSS